MGSGRGAPHTAAMTPTDWEQIRQLFDAALSLPPAQREPHVRASGAPSQVQREVLSLLAHATEHSGGAPAFLQSPAPLDDRAAPVRRARPGLRLNGWTLESLLGAGGMGEVWLARRSDGAYDGEAAIKLLKPGMDSAAVLRRFAQERQALARLDHPHIARLFDAGLDAQGCPFVVMERVQGRSLDAACAGLPLEARLALFLQLADAVAHAHRHLLVHRDLKPGNVMVTEQGQVKLLDFGIAKALDPLESTDLDRSQVGERPLTPGYASPEQLRGEPVSTATDVYSLGVLLYLLLTGRRPYGRDATDAAAMARAALNEAPSLPSSLPSPGPQDPAWPALRERLKGDLDNMLLKALEKDPARRYATVDQFAADLRAFLQGRPVSARPQTMAYLMARFVSRNRLAVALACVALLSLVGGLAGTLWQMRVAQHAQARAEHRFAQLRELSRQMVFRYHDDIAELPGSLATREALLKDALGYLDGLAEELGPELHRNPRLAQELAESYSRIASLQGDGFSPSQEQLDASQRNVDKAIALQAHYIDALAQDGDALRIAAEMYQGSAMLASRGGRLADSVQALQQARGLNERALALQPDDAKTMAAVATIVGRIGLQQGGSPSQPQLGDLAAAGQTIAQAVALFDTLRARLPDQAELIHEAAWAHQLLANWALLSGDANVARREADLMLALRDAALRLQPENGNLRYQRALALAAAGRIHGELGDAARGLQLFDDSFAALGEELKRDGRNQAARRDLVLLRFTRARLAWQHSRSAPDAKALRDALAAMPAAAALAGDFYLSRWRADAAWWVGESSDRADEKLARAQEAEALMRATPDQPENASRRWMLAQALGLQADAHAQRGDAARARTLARQALALWQPGAPALYRQEAARTQALATE